MYPSGMEQSGREGSTDTKSWAGQRRFGLTGEGVEQMGKTKNRKNRIHRFRFYTSYQKERKWLEDMALKGWFLEDLSLGIYFTFVRGTPRRYLYDVDRFNLSKRPTLEEIRRKEMFLEMARELGWREVTHDESMTYYFAKEYEEGGINELHNDPDSRRYRAEKFQAFLKESAKRQVFWGAVVAVADLVVKLFQLLFQRYNLGWYDWVTLIYVILANFMSVAAWRWGDRCAAEMTMTRAEWEESTDPAVHKSVRKLIFTVKKLKQFLQDQARKGWILTDVTPTRYFFEKREGVNQVYTMDSKWLVNRRRKELDQERIADSKDWNGLNNDWQIQSVHDAEERGWTFVCALENRTVIYRGEEGRISPLNDRKYDRKLRWISLVGEYGFYLLLCVLAGGIAGFILGMIQEF